MTTHAIHHHGDALLETAALPAHGAEALRYAVPVGRLLFTLLFLESVPGHFMTATIRHAADQGVPTASVLVPASGVLALLGGLSVLLGIKARIGALLLILFLVPVTLMMHRFWTIDDPQLAMMQRIMFMKNVSMVGGAMILSYFGAGPISFDARHASKA
jgi:putative oxidoreductase